MLHPPCPLNTNTILSSKFRLRLFAIQILRDLQTKIRSQSAGNQLQSRVHFGASFALRPFAGHRSVGDRTETAQLHCQQQHDERYEINVRRMEFQCRTSARTVQGAACNSKYETLINFSIGPISLNLLYFFFLFFKMRDVILSATIRPHPFRSDNLTSSRLPPLPSNVTTVVQPTRSESNKIGFASLTASLRNTLLKRRKMFGWTSTGTGAWSNSSSTKQSAKQNVAPVLLEFDLDSNLKLLPTKIDGDGNILLHDPSGRSTASFGTSINNLSSLAIERIAFCNEHADKWRREIKVAHDVIPRAPPLSGTDGGRMNRPRSRSHRVAGQFTLDRAIHLQRAQSSCGALGDRAARSKLTSSDHRQCVRSYSHHRPAFTSSYPFRPEIIDQKLKSKSKLQNQTWNMFQSHPWKLDSDTFNRWNSKQDGNNNQLPIPSIRSTKGVPLVPMEFRWNQSDDHLDQFPDRDFISFHPSQFDTSQFTGSRCAQCEVNAKRSLDSVLNSADCANCGGPAGSPAINSNQSNIAAFRLKPAKCKSTGDPPIARSSPALDWTQVESLSLSHLYESLRMQSKMDRKETLDVILTSDALNSMQSKDGDPYRSAQIDADRLFDLQLKQLNKKHNFKASSANRLRHSKSDLDVRYAPFGEFTSTLQQTQLPPLPRVSQHQLRNKERSWSANKMIEFKWTKNELLLFH